MLRLTIFFLCPFRYSESILYKIYENLIQMLVIKRCKHSFKTSKHLFEDSESNIFDCLIYFFYNLFCSCCCTKNLDDNPSFFVVNSIDSQFKPFSDSHSATKSTSDTSTIFVQLNEAFCCFSCINSYENKSIGKSVSTDQLRTSSTKLKRSTSCNSYKPKKGSFKEYNSFHRKMRRKHNRMQKNYKLIDWRFIRYGTGHFIQRVFDIFLLIWFICGNYWTFSVDLNETSLYNSLDRNVSQTKYYFQYSPTVNVSILEKIKLSTQSVHKNETILESDIKNLHKQSSNLTSLNRCNPICYQTAFSQIIITYSVFVFSFVLIILFRICSLEPKNILIKKVSNTCTRKRSYSLP